MKNVMNWEQFNESEDYKLPEIPTETINHDISKFITEICGFMSGWFIKFGVDNKYAVNLTLSGALTQYETALNGQKWGLTDMYKNTKMTIEEKVVKTYEKSAKHFGLTEKPPINTDNAFHTIAKAFISKGSPSTPAFVGLGRLLSNGEAHNELKNVTMILTNGLGVDPTNELVELYGIWREENPNVN